MTEISNTAKRHPRSLVEAFPKTPEYGCSIASYKRPRSLLDRWHYLAFVYLVIIGLYVLFE